MLVYQNYYFFLINQITSLDNLGTEMTGDYPQLQDVTLHGDIT